MRHSSFTILLASSLTISLGCSSILGLSGDPVVRGGRLQDAEVPEDGGDDGSPQTDGGALDAGVKSCDFPDAGGPFATDMPNIVLSSPSSFEDDSRWRSTATSTSDTRTGLKWQLKTVDAEGAPVLVTFPEAEEACRTLSLGGETGWRLPTKFELFTVVQYNAFKPDTIAHGDSPTNGISPTGIAEMADVSVAQGYWSSSKTPTGQIWHVNHGPGESRPDPLDSTARVRVRCVK